MGNQRLIDADALRERIAEALDDTSPDKGLVLKCIEDQPVIDPVVHANWVFSPRNGRIFEWCSNCKATIWEYRAKYCHNCGARLDAAAIWDWEDEKNGKK